MQSPELHLLVIAGVLNSLVSVYYYLRVMVAMYFQDEKQAWQPYRSVGMGATLAVTALVVLAIGISPVWLVDLLPGAVGSLAGR
jgi:NADH-quinone oxidoreductase subunit N